ncbi:kinase-like domain-containing protein [Mycena filopes]|nr:kinase-like domain-containing protein [Mycena filopes]
MTSDNIITCIVQSSEHRRILLELASKLGLATNLNLRTALRAGEERIAALLVSIFSSQLQQDAVLRLEGDPAQCFLDVTQDLLDRGLLIAPEHSGMARRIVRKLSASSDRFPSSIFITGITGQEDYPTFGGRFGDVYRVSCNNQLVALKYMRAVHFLRGEELRRIRSKFSREALVWRSLQHRHILPFLGIDQNNYPSSLCMVSPWMEHGTILNYLKRHGRANVDELLYEIAQGLEYLHSRKIVHGDLRGANILINEESSACLADFGLSDFTDATASNSTRGGSPHWMAPELHDPKRFGYTKFTRTTASDVYAFGCVCVELYTGRKPFSELPEGGVLLEVLAGRRTERPLGTSAMSDRLWNHVTVYWAQDPRARLSAQTLVEEMVWPIPEPKMSRPPRTLTKPPPRPSPERDKRSWLSLSTWLPKQGKRLQKKSSSPEFVSRHYPASHRASKASSAYKAHENDEISFEAGQMLDVVNADKSRGEVTKAGGLMRLTPSNYNYLYPTPEPTEASEASVSSKPGAVAADSKQRPCLPLR